MIQDTYDDEVSESMEENNFAKVQDEKVMFHPLLKKTEENDSSHKDTIL